MIKGEELRRGVEILCCRFRVISPGAAEAMQAHAECLEGYTSAGKWWLQVDGVRIWAQLYQDGQVQVWMEPGVANWEQHRERAAALMLAAKLAASIASRCGGKVYQEATVTECLAHLREKTNLVADYPGEPLHFRRLCPGLQAVLVGSETA